MMIMGLCHCYAIEMRVAYDHLTMRESCKPGNEFWKCFGTEHMGFINAMDRDVDVVELFTRIDQNNIRGNLLPVLENHRANLADTSHARVCRFDVQCNEPHASPPQRLQVCR